MANNIYDSTWWGNTIDTASSIGTSTDMIQGQFNLTKLGDELVTNGDFATDSDWGKGTGWTISGGTANALSAGSAVSITQNGVVESGKTYKITYTVSNYVEGGIYFRAGSGANGNIRQENGTFTEIVTQSGNTTFYLTCYTGSTTLSIDNASVKEVRATTVEASKCLADAIHRIGIQDIQN